MRAKPASLIESYRGPDQEPMAHEGSHVTLTTLLASGPVGSGVNVF